MKNKASSTVIPLKKAVEKLHHFNEACAKNDDSTLPRTAELMRRVFKGEEIQHDEERQELLRAVEVLKNHIPQIFQMKEGTLHQRKLAVSALAAIERYNEITERMEKKSESLKLRIASYITGKNILTKLPRIEFVCHRATSVKTSSVMKEIRPVKTREIPHLSQQAAELFFMKVISLLESHLFVSSSEARQLVEESVIHVTIAKTTTQCTVSCEVTSLRIDGDFVLDPKTSLYSFPVTQGFRVNH